MGSGRSRGKLSAVLEPVHPSRPINGPCRLFTIRMEAEACAFAGKARKTNSIFPIAATRCRPRASSLPVLPPPNRGTGYPYPRRIGG